MTTSISAPSDEKCPDGVGVAIRAIRKRLGLTQVAFSKILSVQQNTLSQFETGYSKPRTERLIHLLRMACTDGEKAPIVKALEDRCRRICAQRAGISASDLAIFTSTPILPHSANIGDQRGKFNV